MEIWQFEIRCRYGDKFWDFAFESEERVGAVSDRIVRALEGEEPPRTEDRAKEMAEAVAKAMNALPITQPGNPKGRFLLKMKSGAVSYGPVRRETDV